MRLFGLTLIKNIESESNDTAVIDGILDKQALKCVEAHFYLIDEACKSYQEQDLRSLQLQGQKIYPEILRILGIDMSEIDKNKNGVGFHETGIFSSKFITFALHELELENRDSRLSLVGAFILFHLLFI